MRMVLFIWKFDKEGTFLSGILEPVDIVDNGDHTHTVNYVPTKEGPYSINVLYADEPVPSRWVSVIFLRIS